MMSTEGKTVSFRAQSFRRLPDPVDGEKRDRYFVMCDVDRLPKELPTDTNPREQNTETKVAKRIRAGLLGESGPIFHLLNRGLLISAARVEFDNKSNVVTIHMPDGSRHGLVDGGHTYRIILDNLESLPLNQFVSMEIMTGIEDDFTNIAGARNTSVQVQEKSLADLEKKLDVVKLLVDGLPFADQVAYRQFEDKDIDVLDVIALLTIFNPDMQASTDDHPIHCYSSKGRTLNMFLSGQKRETYAKMRGVAPGVFQLHDHVHKTFVSYYSEATGGRAGKRKEIGYKDRPHYPLRFSPRTLAGDYEKIQYEIPSGFVYPMLGAMRFLIESTGNSAALAWRVPDPIRFYDEHVGKDLVRTTMEASLEQGQNPNAVGKSRRHWESLYNIVARKYLETQAG